MDDWVAELQAGKPESAWDRFLDRYRRLIFSAIRHYAQDYDDVMDVFAQVCEALRADDLRRLRCYVDQTDHRARFSTWLVTVVRHLTIDWFRHRDGRRRISTVAERLPPLQRRIFEHVFLDRRSHAEAYELIRTGETRDLSFKEYQAELRATYRAVTNGRRGGVLRELGAPPPPDVESDSPHYADRREAREFIARALGALSDEDRVAVELHHHARLPGRRHDRRPRRGDSRCSRARGGAAPPRDLPALPRRRRVGRARAGGPRRVARDLSGRWRSRAPPVADRTAGCGGGSDPGRDRVAALGE